MPDRVFPSSSSASRPPGPCPARILLVTIGLLLAAVSGTGAYDAFPDLTGNWRVITVDSDPQDVASGDFDEDGDHDLLVLSASLSRLQVFSGGVSGPEAGATYATGPGPSELGVADFDGDSHLDVAHANFDGGFIGVRYGDGAGGFGARTDLTPLGFPSGLNVSDVTGDGLPDIVTYSGHFVSVFRSLGAAGFAPLVTLDAVFPLVSLITGELTGDGLPDIGVSMSVAGGKIFPGLGGGTFAPSVSMGLPTLWSCVAAGDLDQDSRTDIVVRASSNWGYLPALPGGGFGPLVSYPVAQLGAAGKLGIVDLGGDAYPDVVITLNVVDRVEIWGGGAGGSFSLRETLDVGRGPWGFTHGNCLAGSGADLVVLHLETAALALFDGSGPSFVNSPGRLEPGHHLRSFALADFNEDGRQDIVTADSPAGLLRPWFGSLPGSFSPGSPLAIEANSIVNAEIGAGDVDGDANQDILALTRDAATSELTLWFYRGVGDGAFLLAEERPLGTGMPRPLQILDLDADGVDDIVASPGGTTLVFFGVRFGTPGAAVSIGPGGTAMAFGDVDGNGLADMVRTSGTGFEVILNRPTRIFLPPLAVAIGFSATEPAVADMNYDGRADVLACRAGTPAVYVVPALGGGSFGAAIPLVTRSPASSVVGGEFNGDGRPDVLASVPGGSEVAVFLGQGALTFGPRFDLGSGIGVARGHLADLEFDERDDVVLAATESNAVLLHRNFGSYVSGVPVGGPATTRWVLRAWPSPGRGSVQFEVPAEFGPILGFEIFDLQGRLIARPRVEAFATRLQWDGRDRDGRVRAEGVYFARLRGGRGVATTRILRQ